MNKLIQILLFLSPVLGVCQKFTIEEQHEIDSLNKIINDPNAYDTSMAGAYIKLSQILYISNFDTLKILCEESKKIIDKALLSDPPEQTKNTLLKYLAGALSNIGYVHKGHGDITKTLEYWNESLDIQRKINDKEGLSSTLNNIGYIYKSQGNIEKALEYYYESLSLSNEIKDINGEAFSFNNIGLLYYEQGDISKAIEYCNHSLELRRKINDKNGISQTLNNLGVIYENQNNNDLALTYYQESLSIRKKMGDKKEVAKSLQHVGKILCELDSTHQGINLLKEGFQILMELDDKLWVGYSADVISSEYLKLNKIDSAEYYANISLKIGQQINYPSSIKRAAVLLSDIYGQQNKWKESLKMYKLYIQMRDSLDNEKNQKAVAKQQAKYEYEKQKAIDDAEHEKQLAIKQKAKEKQKVITYATTGGLGLVGIFLLVVFNRLKVTRKQKNIIEHQKQEVEEQKSVVELAHSELEEKNKEIMDSITYAKRIQSAILPPDKLVKEYLQESFILYKPKDIVAGDFYWMEQKNDKVLFAAADCTGHGVPGAMVSVICNNGLNRSVREYGLTDPGKILDKTREIVIQEFEKSEDEVKDGMDIALCSLQQLADSYQLQYAGAHNPLWIITSSLEGGKEVGEKSPLKSHFDKLCASSQGDKWLVEIKANKQPIGKFDHPEPYTTHTVELKKGDTIYIFSDGYVDQFGGEKGKKYKTANFKKLLLSIQNETMYNQKQVLDQAFEKWKGELEQLDDVCVIGVKI